ncbi:hypothetical protein H072_1987 [Dactylellina haptotyla CBS 200.50]|uniref:Uncharacterized protein n=1 Tax=Dactylellina haptotyla (strain CBS 200.50) TaxID=1284197 RepID=S8ASQ2_DACHA|nr:hypothetical protein H072_1987 [Dactylellina haptotyla CBS 200.50]
MKTPTFPLSRSSQFKKQPAFPTSPPICLEEVCKSIVCETDPGLSVRPEHELNLERSLKILADFRAKRTKEILCPVAPKETALRAPPPTISCKPEREHLTTAKPKSPNLSPAHLLKNEQERDELDRELKLLVVRMVTIERQTQLEKMLEQAEELRNELTFLQQQEEDLKALLKFPQKNPDILSTSPLAAGTPELSKTIRELSSDSSDERVDTGVREDTGGKESEEEKADSEEFELSGDDGISGDQPFYNPDELEIIADNRMGKKTADKNITEPIYIERKRASRPGPWDIDSKMPRTQIATSALPLDHKAQPKQLSVDELWRKVDRLPDSVWEKKSTLVSRNLQGETPRSVIVVKSKNDVDKKRARRSPSPELGNHLKRVRVQENSDGEHTPFIRQKKQPLVHQTASKPNASSPDPLLSTATPGVKLSKGEPIVKGKDRQSDADKQKMMKDTIDDLQQFFNMGE